MLADDVRTGTLRPNLQLVSSSGTERIAGNQQHLLALAHQLGGDLADGGGLAHAVDADDQDHGRLGGKVQLQAAHLQHTGEDILQRGLCFFGGL